MAKLYYQGHGSCRITSNNGRALYIDPFAGDGYEPPADIILVSHQHKDHNKIDLCTQNTGCRIITNTEALAGGVHQTFSFDGFRIEATVAKNLAHSPKKCVGFIITVDGVTLYTTGDTWQTAQMRTFAARHFDYALFTCDGIFNMSPRAAAKCARLIAAKHNIPIHLRLTKIFDEARAQKWNAPNKLIVKPGEEIAL